ncbi:MAG TPA: NmrA family NAD(P)-binding protein [Polyangiaceae bacterium]|nr:NmrA family NAD(P)-binding protein [Polyangiaceae bacterium]
MIVVLGASGRTGQVVARQVRAGSEAVRLVTRSAAIRADEPGVEVVRARLSDGEELRRAFAGARASYVLLPEELGAQEIHAERRRWVETLVSALRRAAVEHVVLLSSRAAALGETAESGFARELALLERRLFESVPAVTVLRASYFQDNVLQAVPTAARDGVYLNCLSETASVDMTAACDVGEVAARALLRQPRVEKEVVDVVGPAYSPVEVASALGDLVGRPVSVTFVPPDAREGLFQRWMSREAARALRETLDSVSASVALRGSRCERGATRLEQVLRAAREVTK